MNISFLKNIIKNNNVSNSQIMNLNKSRLQKNKLANNFSAADDFAYFNAMKNYNISFFGNQKEIKQSNEKPVYIIDAYKNYLKFDSAEIAASVLKIPSDRIVKCAQGEVDYVRDFVAAYAENIENETFEGVKVDEMMLGVCVELLKAIQRHNSFLSIDEFIKKQNEKDKNFKQTSFYTPLNAINNESENKNEPYFDIDSIPAEDLSKVNPKFLKTPFYAMTKDGKYRKFYLQSHIAKSLNVTKQSVSKTLHGDRKLVDGVLALCWADEIEHIDEKGNLQLNLEPLKEKFETKKGDGFYAVDKSGAYKKFYSAKEASKILNVPHVSVLRCLLNKEYCAGDYVFIKAKDIEIIDKNGKIDVDLETIKERKVEIFRGAVYLVDENLKPKRYDTPALAGKAIRASKAQISACALGRRDFVNGFAVFSAADVETYDKCGRKRVNKKKIENLYNALEKPEVLDLKNGFYAYDKNECKGKFYKIADAQRELGVSGATISGCLKNRLNLGGGYIFILADEIEIKDENDNINIDEVKLQKRLEFFKDKSLYAVYKNGDCVFYDSQTDASKDTKIPIGGICACINGRKKSAGNVAFVPAKKLEIKDDSGEVKLDEDLIKELTSWLNRKESGAFYAVDENENYQRFSTRSEGIEKLKIDKANLSACLLGKSKTTGGFAYINAWEVETIDADGNIVVDVDKIKERAKLFIKKQPRFKNFNVVA